MIEAPHIPVRPPGPQRPHRKPEHSGKIPFHSTAAGISGETAYWLWGTPSPEKCPLIVLHGGPGATHGYMRHLSLVNDDFDVPVLIYDQMGCGESTRFKDRRGDEKLWTPDLFVEELVNITVWLREQYGVTHYDVLGHSWGGRLAALLAIRRQPEGLRKVVICNVSTDPRMLQDRRRKLRSEMPEEVKQTLARRDGGEEVDPDVSRQAMQYEMALHACRTAPVPPELMGATAGLREDDTVYETMMGVRMSGSLMRMPTIISDHLHEITETTCPGGMLIVSGQHDMSQDADMRGWFTAPRCRVKWFRLPLSSHFVMFEETETFIWAVGTFLTSE